MTSDVDYAANRDVWIVCDRKERSNSSLRSDLTAGALNVARECVARYYLAVPWSDVLSQSNDLLFCCTGASGITGQVAQATNNRWRRPAATLARHRSARRGISGPCVSSNGLLNETALSAVSKCALTRCINASCDWRFLPEDYPTPRRYARG